MVVKTRYRNVNVRLTIASLEPKIAKKLNSKQTGPIECVTLIFFINKKKFFIIRHINVIIFLLFLYKTYQGRVFMKYRGCSLLKKKRKCLNKHSRLIVKIVYSINYKSIREMSYMDSVGSSKIQNVVD